MNAAPLTQFPHATPAAQYAAAVARAQFAVSAGETGVGLSTFAQREAIRASAIALVEKLASAEWSGKEAREIQRQIMMERDAPEHSWADLAQISIDYAKALSAFKAMPENEQRRAAAQTQGSGWTRWAGLADLPESASMGRGLGLGAELGAKDDSRQSSPSATLARAARLGRAAWLLASVDNIKSVEQAKARVAQESLWEATQKAAKARQDAWLRWGAERPAEKNDAAWREAEESHLAGVRSGIQRRFGLRELSVEGELDLSSRQQRALLSRLERSMERSCQTLGCAELDFGLRGQVGVRLEAPGVDHRNQGRLGVFRSGLPGDDRGAGTIGVSAAALDRDDTFTHEWTHALDWRVGQIVAPELKSFFTALPRALQERSPQARDAVELIFAAVGADGDLEKSRQAIAWLEERRDRVGMNLAGRLLGKAAPMEKMAALADRFGNAEIFVAQSLAGVLKTQPEFWRAARGAFANAQNGVADGLPGDPNGALRRHLLVALAQHNGSSEEKMEQAVKSGDLSLSEQMADAFTSQMDLLRQLARASHMTNQQATGVFWAGESVFAQGSEIMDIGAAAAGEYALGDKPYWSEPIEVFARSVGRSLDADARKRSALANSAFTPIFGEKAQKALRQGLREFAAVAEVEIQQELTATERVESRWVDHEGGAQKLSEALTRRREAATVAKLDAIRIAREGRQDKKSMGPGA